MARWSDWQKPYRTRGLDFGALALAAILAARADVTAGSPSGEGRLTALTDGANLYLPALSHVSPSPPLEDWTIVGHLGGPVSAVEVVFPYAYVGMAYGLTVFDVSDPMQPRQVARLGGLSGDEWPGLDEAGGRIYVAGDVLGLGIVDISRPDAPRLMAQVSDLTADVVRVSGERAYVLSRQGELEIVDVARPEAPQRLGRLELEGDFWALDVVGGLVYLVEVEDPALSIVDVSSPGTPRLVSRARLGTAAWAIHVVGPLAYLADDQGVRMVDVSDPSAIQLLSDFTVPDGATDIVLDGGRVYLAGGDGLEVLDLSDPPWIRTLAYADTEGDPMDLEVVDGVAYLAEAGGLRLIDVRTAEGTVPPGGFRLPVVGGIDVPGPIDDVDAYGDYAVATDLNHGLVVFDVSQPHAPRLVGRAPLRWLSDPDQVAHLWAIQVREGLAFVVADDEGEDGSLRVLDVSDPRSPTELAAVRTGGIPADIAIAGETAYVASGAAGLLAVDISVPADLRVVGQIDVDGPAQGVHVSGSLAAVAKHMAGLELVDVSDPALPRSLATLDTAGFVTAVALHGSLLLATDMGVDDPAGGTNLVVVDVSTPTAPRVIATLMLEGSLQSIEVDFPRAYIGGHHLVDIADPSAPRLIRTLPTKGPLRVHGRLGYMASVDNGLAILALGPR